MNEVIRHIARQKPIIQQLIGHMVDAIRQDRNVLSILQPKMTKEKLKWLRQNGFEVEFNNNTKEWEITLYEEDIR